MELKKNKITAYVNVINEVNGEVRNRIIISGEIIKDHVRVEAKSMQPMKKQNKR